MAQFQPISLLLCGCLVPLLWVKWLSFQPLDIGFEVLNLVDSVLVVQNTEILPISLNRRNGFEECYEVFYVSILTSSSLISLNDT